MPKDLLLRQQRNTLGMYYDRFDTKINALNTRHATGFFLKILVCSNYVST